MTDDIELTGIVAVLLAVAAVAWLIRKLHARTHGKLDEIHGEVRSVHTRHDLTEQRVEHAHYKLDRLRHGMALLFKGEGKEFVAWWKSWFER